MLGPAVAVVDEDDANAYSDNKKWVNTVAVPMVVCGDGVSNNTASGV